MKIAYLSTFYPYRGGIAQFNAALFRVFENMHDINAYTFFRQYPDLLFPGQSQLVQEGDTADKVPAEKILDTINPLGYERAARKVKSFAPDLFITKFWMPFFGPSLGWVAKRLRKKGTVNISILDNVIPHEPRVGDLQLTHFFLEQNDGFIVMSEKVRDDLLSLKPDAKFEFHPHPLYDHFGDKIDKYDARAKLNIPVDKKILLFFGFIRDYKGLDLLLEALRLLPEDYHLVIAGESYGSFKKYEEYIEENNLTDRVSLHVRYIGDNEVPLFFSAADACILPYKSATQSGIVGISYHFDLPVIATDVGGLKEMIEPLNTGLLIGKAEGSMIRESIMKYFDEQLFAEYEVNIQEYKRKYNWESLANSIIKLHKNIADSK